MQTENLILKQLQLNNLEDYFEIVSSDKVSDDLQLIKSKELAKEKIKQTLIEAQKRSKFTFSIIYKENKKMIGFIELGIKPKQTGELTCVIHPDYWNKGYGSEAMLEVEHFALDKMKLKRLCGICSSFNSSCTSLFKNVLGFEYTTSEYINGKDYLYFEKKH